MSLYVDLSPPEAQALELVAFVNGLLVKDEPDGSKDAKDTAEDGKDKLASPFSAEMKGLLEKKLYKDFISRMVDVQQVVLEKAPEKETEGCFNLLFALLRKLDTTTRHSHVAKLIAITSANSADHALLRLRLLGNLYNLLEPSSNSRYEAFAALLRYAVESNNAEAVAPQFGKIDAWLRQWDATIEQKRSLYLLVRRIFLQTNDRASAHRYLIKYLATYSEAEPLGDAIEHAKIAAVEAIKLVEAVETDNLLELPAIKQLQQTDPLLYRLLELYSREALEAFHAFHKENPDFLASAGLVFEDCLKNMRLLSLATLATQHEEIPYSVIANTLSIDEGDVESWIILSISTRILDAKLDQLRRVAIINRVTQRAFSKEQWRQLGDRLQAWKESTAALLEVVGKHQLSDRLHDL